MQLHKVILRLYPVDVDGFYDTVLGTYYLQHNATNRFADLARQLGLLNLTIEDAKSVALYHRRGKIVLPHPRLPWIPPSTPIGPYNFDLYVVSEPTTDPERIVILDAAIYA